MGKIPFMFIDDDVAFISYMVQACKKLSCVEVVVTARDGKAALDWLSTASSENIVLPRVILVDRNMPIMDGLEFLRGFSQLRSRHPERLAKIKSIAMLTSSIQEIDWVKAAEFGADRYFTKPETLGEMRNMFEQLAAEVA